MLRIPGPEEFAIVKPSLVEFGRRILERLRVHMAKEDGHDGTYGCKRCADPDNNASVSSIDTGAAGQNAATDHRKLTL